MPLHQTSIDSCDILNENEKHTWYDCKVIIFVSFFFCPLCSIWPSSAAVLYVEVSGRKLPKTIGYSLFFFCSFAFVLFIIYCSRYRTIVKTHQPTLFTELVGVWAVHTAQTKAHLRYSAVNREIPCKTNGMQISQLVLGAIRNLWLKLLLLVLTFPSFSNLCKLRTNLLLLLLCVKCECWAHFCSNIAIAIVFPLLAELIQNTMITHCRME